MRNGRLFLLLLLLGPLSLARTADTRPVPPVTRVPLELNGTAMFLQVRIGGQGPFSFVLDTGASTSLLDAATAESLGLAGQDGGHVTGAAGHVAGQTYRDLSFELGGARLEIPEIAAVPLTAIGKSMGRRVDGVLGADLFRRFVVAIDFEGKALTLHEPAGFVYAGRGDVLPLRFHENLPYVQAKLKLPGTRALEGEFVLDSGSSLAVILLPSFIGEHQLRETLPPTLQTFGRGVGGEVALPIGRSDALKVGRFTIEHPVTSFPTEGFFAHTGGSGNIGGAILKRFKVTFDYSRARVMLEPNASFPEPYDFDMSGLSLVAEAPDFKTIRVHRVLAQTPAQESGILADDEIASVGGRPMADVGLLALREMLRKPGKRIALEVRRGGTPVALELTTRRLI